MEDALLTYTRPQPCHWWRDAETEQLLRDVCEEMSLAQGSAALRLGLRLLARKPPTREQIEWGRATGPCTVRSSWREDTSSRATLERYAREYELDQRMVQRLALRVLADANGVDIPAAVAVA